MRYCVAMYNCGAARGPVVTTRRRLGFASVSFYEVSLRDLELDCDTPITSLHISDLPAGGFERSKLRLEINRWIDPIIEHCGPLSATFVALTGDLAETAAEEYELLELTRFHGPVAVRF
jgi:hypothetical protein